MRKKKWIIIGSILAFLILISLFSKKGRIPNVRTGKVQRGIIEDIVSSPGNTAPEIEVNISADIMGKVINLLVEEGSRVKKGQLLAKIDDSSYRASYDNAKSMLESRKANLALTSSEYKRKQELYGKKLISNQEYERAKTSYKIAQMNLDEALANLKKAKDMLGKTSIRSPINGVITRLNIKEGENVITGTMNNPGTVLMVVSDLSSMIVLCDVSETEIPKIKIGDPVRISIDAFGDTTFRGSVYNIASTPTTTQYTGEEVINYRVKIHIKNPPPNLRPGMSATADIITSSKENVLRILLQSLITKNGKKGVYKVQNKRAVFVPIKTGISSERWIEVKKGLKERDVIITGPYRALKEIKNGQRLPHRKSENRHRIHKGK